MALGGKTEIVCYLDKGIGGIDQQIPGEVDLLVDDIVFKGDPFKPVKEGGKIIRFQPDGIGDFFYGEFIMKVGEDVILAVIYMRIVGTTETVLGGFGKKISSRIGRRSRKVPDSASAASVPGGNPPGRWCGRPLNR